MDHLFGARTRRLRTALGLSQDDLCSRISLSTAWLSQVESGRLLPAHDQASRLAGALDVDLSFLVSGIEEPLMTQPLLRAYADAPRKAVDRQLADAGLMLEVADRLRVPLLPDAVPAWTGDPQDPHDIENYAQAVRFAARITEDAVVGNSIRAAERLGCIVLPMPDELGRHLGISLRVDGTPVVCVSRSTGRSGSIPGDRQRFTVAHELGHIGMHGRLSTPATAQDAAELERQAHYFAGCFLAPGEAMREEFDQAGGRLTLRTLADIKSRWGIAIKALVIRFKNLGLLDDNQARSLYKQISARGWNKSEPVRVGGESGLWLQRALEKQFGPTPIPVAAKKAGIGAMHLSRWTAWEDELEAQVLTFRPRTPAVG